MKNTEYKMGNQHENHGQKGSDKSFLSNFMPKMIRACLKNPYTRKNAHKPPSALSKILARRKPACGISPSTQQSLGIFSNIAIFQTSPRKFRKRLP